MGNNVATASISEHVASAVFMQDYGNIGRIEVST